MCIYYATTTSYIIHHGYQLTTARPTVADKKKKKINKSIYRDEVSI